MNQGIYGFPSTLATSSIISITEFDASGTYTIPSDAAEIEILLVGGGGGGGGGGIVYQRVQVKDLFGRNNLNITIGAGGAGGVGRSDAIATANSGSAGTVAQAGFPSFITIPNYNGFVIQTMAGNGGGAGTTPNQAGAAVGGAGRSSLIASLVAMESGAPGSSTSVTAPGITYSTFRSNGGAGGGSATSTTASLPGGSIKIESILTNTTNPIALNLNFAGITLDGITASWGGAPNGASLGDGKGQDGIFLYKNSAGFLLFGGFGGAGGGGANTVGAGNGGDGYRGGGGGGGGGVRTVATTLSTGQVPSGSGGKGGNGYCRIIARR